MSEIKKKDFLFNSEEWVQGTETADPDTEVVETVENADIVLDTETSTETITEVENNDALVSISYDVHLLLVFTIITFVMSCFRSWRKNTVKGV